MTLREILTTETYSKFGDMDVTNDVIDSMFPAWCGQICTEEGEKEFGEILSCPAHIDEGTLYGAPYGVIVVKVDGPNWKRLYNKAEALFDAMCGYCTEEEYDRWFIDDYDLEEAPKDDGREENAGYQILQKLTASGSGYEEGYVLGFMQKSTGPEWVTWGYHKRPNEEPSYYWGHYFNDADTAKKDLLNRMAGMLNNMESMI